MRSVVAGRRRGPLVIALLLLLVLTVGSGVGLVVGPAATGTLAAETSPPADSAPASPRTVDPSDPDVTDPPDPTATPTPPPTTALTQPPTTGPATDTTAPTTAPPTSTVPTDTATPTPTDEPTGTPTATATVTSSPVATRPATPPSVQTSPVSLASVVAAVVALLLAGIVVWVVARRVPATQHPRAAARRPSTGPDDETRVLPDSGTRVLPAAEGAAALVTFLVALGEAMIDAGEPVNEVQDDLAAVADAKGVGGVEVVVLPTALIVTVPGAGTVETAVAAAGTSRLRLDQVSAVLDLVAQARAGQVEPADGVARLAAVRAQQPPYSAALRTGGYVVLTVGLALILRASSADLVVAALLGLVVGVAQLRTADLDAPLRVFVPVLSAFVVALVVLTLPRTGLDVGLLAPLVAPLVTFLPGALLTTSVIELATGQMIAGASRLAAGLLQLVLLALGIVAASQLVGVPAAGVGEVAAVPLGTFAPWLGVALFGVGVVAYYGARRPTLGWILLVLYVAYAGQVIGGLLFGGVLSAFVGAFAMTPVAAFVARRPSGPPTLVSFLPAFWLLVPGALGLVGVTQVIGDATTAGISTLATTAATMLGIALGVLLGQAVESGLTRVRRP